MNHIWRTGLLLATVYQILLVLLISLSLVHSGQPLLAGWSSRLSGWDGRIYLSLAQHGYQTSGDEANFIVFFPLFPLLIHLVDGITHSLPLAAFLITTSTSILAHALLYVLLRRQGFRAAAALRIFLLFCVNPVTVYFAHAYTEALYLCLTLASFLLLTQKKYSLSALTALFSGMTRLVGSLFLIPFWIAVWGAETGRDRLRALALSLLIPLGFGLYALLNYVSFGDPLHYQIVMREHWHKYPINPFPKMSAEFSSLMTPIDHNFWTMRVDAIMTYLVFFVLCLYGLTRLLNRKKPGLMPLSWFAWTAVSWFIVAAQSYWISNTRYLSILFPLYIIAEHTTWKLRLPYLLLLGVSAFLAIRGIGLFTSGGWLY